MDAASILLFPPALLTIVATGKRLSTSSVSRESMINLLLKHGVEVDQSTVAIAASDRDILLDNPDYTYRYSRTALAWVLGHEPHENISNEERYSIARLLLENRANPNALAVSDKCCPDGTRLLQSCIRHYDVEAVRLLLLHEADASQLAEYQGFFHLRFAEALQGETTMSELVREYDIPSPFANDCRDPIASLVAQSGSLIGIGSSHVGMIIALAHQRRHESRSASISSRNKRLNAWISEEGTIVERLISQDPRVGLDNALSIAIE